MAAENWIVAAALGASLACASCAAKLPFVDSADTAGANGSLAPPSGELSPQSGAVAPVQVGGDGGRQPSSASAPAAVAVGPSTASSGPGPARILSNGGSTGCGRCKITAFKPAIVTLFMSESGQDGQRVPKAALPVPVVASSNDPAKPRLEIMTLDGPRWVSIADVVIDRTP